MKFSFVLVSSMESVHVLLTAAVYICCDRMRLVVAILQQKWRQTFQVKQKTVAVNCMQKIWRPATMKSPKITCRTGQVVLVDCDV
jgi:hypothetical protein